MPVAGMMKNRNVHSLCLVLHQASSPPPPTAGSSSVEPSPLPLQGSTLTSNNISQSASGAGLSSSQTLISGAINPICGAQSSLETKQPEVSCLLSHPSASFSSKSSIFKEGVITPITPNFSPATRGHQALKHSSSSPAKSKLHGRSMQSGHSKSSTTDCDTPDSLENNASWHYNDGGLVQQQTQNLGRYASLSNLPTPPLSDSSSSPVLFPEASGDDLRSADLNGAAQYLASLIPTSASASPASIPLLRRILYRLNIRIEIIALAGIILDTLTAQFVRKWRTELARVSLWEDGGNKCEVLALVALGIAIKWMEDSGVSLTATFLSDVSGERFCPREINVTERLILQEVGYGLKGMSCEAEIAWSVREIERWTKTGDEMEDC